MRNTATRAGLFFGTFAVLVAACAGAQYAGPALSDAAQSAAVLNRAAQAAADERILPNDVLSISVFGAPELSTATSTILTRSLLPGNAATVPGVQLDARGQMEFPYLGQVRLSGKTTDEAARLLAKGLKDAGLMTDPQVRVQLLDSPSRLIFVLGEVAKPEPIPAFGSVRLLDALSAWGGLTQFASHRLEIRRTGQTAPLEVELGTDARAAEAANLPLRAGDTVLVPRVGNVYIVGEVRTPSVYPLVGNAPITVIRALAMSGGLKFPAAMTKACIIRTGVNQQRTRVPVNLRRVLAGKDPDVTLASDDVLYIPTNAVKATISGGGASVAATIAYESAYLAFLH